MNASIFALNPSFAAKLARSRSLRARIGNRMNEWLARLEGAFDRLKAVGTSIVAILPGGFAFLSVQVTRTDNKVAALSGQMAGLHNLIGANIQDLTKTFAAPKQTPPPSAPQPPSK
jgi:hypothetical protein